VNSGLAPTNQDHQIHMGAREMNLSAPTRPRRPGLAGVDIRGRERFDDQIRLHPRRADDQHLWTNQPTE
jgi:hypothetical protein